MTATRKLAQWTAAAALAGAALFGATAAQARSDVFFSVGVNLPPIGLAIGNAPQYSPYYAPQPVYYSPPPVYYAPRPVYYQPAPVYYAPRYGHGHRHHIKHDRHRGHGYGHGQGPRGQHRGHYR